MPDPSSSPGTCSQLTDAISTLTGQVPKTESIQFICETVVNFERFFGKANRDSMRKIINETCMHYGPSTQFRDDENMIPIYALHGQYSRSMNGSDVFEKLYDMGCYRQSALFYFEWSKAYLEQKIFDRAEVVVEEGIKRGARPAHILDDALRNVSMAKRAVLSPVTVQEPLKPQSHKMIPASQPVKDEKARQGDRFKIRKPNVKLPLPQPHAQLPPRQPSIARKALFAEERTPQDSAPIVPSTAIILPAQESQAKKPHEAAPSVPSNAIVLPVQKSEANIPAIGLEPAELPPTEFRAPTPSPVENPNRASSMVAPPDANTENLNPNPNEEHVPAPRRKLQGILVPAVGFQLEDYDFEKEDEMELKTKENVQNIKNGEVSVARMTLPPPVVPVLPTTFMEPRAEESNIDDELGPCFKDSDAFLKALGDPDEYDDRQLTAFEMRRQSGFRLSLSMQRHRLSMIENPEKRAQRDMLDALSKLGINDDVAGTSASSSYVANRKPVKHHKNPFQN